MDIKASVNIFEGGVEDSVNFSVKSERYDKKKGIKVKSNFDINFKMSPTPTRIRILNINNEAYDYMTSKECPKWSKKAEWLSMSKKKRFEAHLSRIANDFRGKVVHYEVFED
jgi:hypothetical protein